jgi:hypothetical protein
MLVLLSVIINGLLIFIIIRARKVNHSPLTLHIAAPEHTSRAYEYLVKSSFGSEGSSRLLDEAVSSCWLLPRLKMALLPQHTRRHIVAKPEVFQTHQFRIKNYPIRQNL